MATPVAGQQAVPMVPQMGQLPSTATAAIPVSGLGLAALGGALYLLRRRR